MVKHLQYYNQKKKVINFKFTKIMQKILIDQFKLINGFVDLMIIKKKYSNQKRNKTNKHAIT